MSNTYNILDKIYVYYNESDDKINYMEDNSTVAGFNIVKGVITRLQKHEDNTIMAASATVVLKNNTTRVIEVYNFCVDKTRRGLKRKITKKLVVDYKNKKEYMLNKLRYKLSHLEGQ